LRSVHLALRCRTGIEYRIAASSVVFATTKEGWITAILPGIGSIRLPYEFSIDHVDYALAAASEYGPALGVVHLGVKYGAAQLPPLVQPPPAFKPL